MTTTIGLSKLLLLDISSNSLGEIPPQLCSLVSLKRLSLAHNELTYIREELPLSRLSNLTTLVLALSLLLVFASLFHLSSHFVFIAKVFA